MPLHAEKAQMCRVSEAMLKAAKLIGDLSGH
jgi:hypothetical protein